MSSRSRHEGYLMIDHRASPGIDPQTAQALGLDPKQCGEGSLMEAASLTCAHCKNVVLKNPLRQRERAYCPKCDHFICDWCDADRHLPDYKHLQFEKFADTVVSLGERGITLGSRQELLQLPTRITKIQS